MQMHEIALFLLEVWNLTSVYIVLLDPISYMTREFRRFANIQGRNWYIHVCLDSHDHLAKNGGVWGNRGRSGAMLTPTNLFLLLVVVASIRSSNHQKSSMPLLAKIDQEMRPWECGQTDIKTHTVTETNWIYSLYYAICYSYGADNDGMCEGVRPNSTNPSTLDPPLGLRLSDHVSQKTRLNCRIFLYVLSVAVARSSSDDNAIRYHWRQPQNRNYTVGHKKRSQVIFVCNFVKNQWILMQFLLSELTMNDTCDGVNITHLT